MPTPPRSSPPLAKSKSITFRPSRMRLFKIKRSKREISTESGPYDVAVINNAMRKPSLQISIPQAESLLVSEDVPMVIPLSLTRSDSESPSSTQCTPKELKTKISIDELPQESYFESNDFSKNNWMETVEKPSAESLSFGFLSIMAATVVIHPILFVTGAATAVWAVGIVHAAEKGYEFFSDGQFKNMFWADSDREQFEFDDQVDSEESDGHIDSGDKVISSTSTNASINCASPSGASSSKSKSSDSDSEDIGSPLHPPTTPMTSPPSSTLSRRHVTPNDEAIIAQFPQLDTEVVTADMPGLNALEFFHVFLSDSAPYNFKEFQETRGDVDIEYGKWAKFNDEKVSFNPNAVKTSNFPTSSSKERVLTFKTLTKSYFGPAYASAKKTQRVTKFSTRLVIVESKTELFGIPYSDRFFVVEKWIIEAIKHDKKDNPQMLYTTKLSVSVEVFMLKDCNWEKQIRQKTLATMTELVTSWTEKATQALDLTLKRKLERLRLLNDTADTKSLYSYRSKDSRKATKRRIASSPTLTTLRENGIETSRQALMNIHRNRLKVLEKKAASGDLEWCSVELKHCIGDGEGKSFAEVLDSTAIFATDLENDIRDLEAMNIDDDNDSDSDNDDESIGRPREISITTKTSKRKKLSIKKRLFERKKNNRN